MKHTSLFTLLVIASSFFLSSCKKSKMVTQDSDARAIHAQILPFLDSENTVAQYIFVRHAEKKKEENPGLTEAGTARADMLAQLLEKVDVDKVFSTDYKRTRQTATPTAAAKHLKLEIYDPRDLENFGASLLKNTPNHTVLVVGHSNTTPTLANHVMGSEKVEKIPETDYDNLFIIRKLKNGALELLKLEFDQQGLKPIKL